MKHHITEIDHLVCAVGDAEAAGARLERLGFVVSPVSILSGLGVMNRLVLMPPLTEGTANFLEVMSPAEGLAIHPHMGEMLAGDERVRWLVLSSSDARTTHASMTAEGYAFGPVVDVDRDWRLASGEVVRPSFSVTLPIDRELPFNFLQYRNIAPYQRAEWFAHPNGARHISDVLYLGDDARAKAGFAERLFGRRATPSANGEWQISPGEVSLRLATRGYARARYGSVVDGLADGLIGCRIRVADVARTRAVLDANGIDHAASASAILVPPTAAAGALIEFYN